MLSVFRPPVAALLVVLAAAFSVALQQSGGSPAEFIGADTDGTLAAPPLAFEPNRGQTDADVRYLARSAGYSLFLTRDAFSVSLRGEQSALVSIDFAGSDATPRIVPKRKLRGTTNYLVGANRSDWKTGIPTYGAVEYRGVYPGIDAVFYGNERRLEYDFVVAPGADPSVIALDVDGVSALRVNARGDLVASTAAGPLVQRRPVIYQDVDGARQHVAGGYVVDGSRVRFRIADYDRSRPLVIDPVLVYSTFVGGSSYDKVHAVAVDASGAAFVGGTTASADYPGTGGVIQGVYDAFVTKLDATGSTVLWSTVFAGTGNERTHGLALASDGSVHLMGRTNSTDLPTLNAVQAASGGGIDVFVTKLTADGALAYSTYLGGSDNDGETHVGIAVDSLGSAYVAGSALSGDFPATATFGPGGGYGDPFVTKLAPTGSSIVFSARFGGTGTDDAADVAIDEYGQAYVTGATASYDFPLTPGGAAKSSNWEAFVTKLNASGTALVYSTYVGGGGNDSAHEIALDASGRAVIAGESASGPKFGCKWANADAYWARLDPAGVLADSACLGGSTGDAAYGVALGANRIYMAGYTGSLSPWYSPFPVTAGAWRTDATGTSPEGFLAAFTDEATAPPPPPPPPPPPSADVSVTLADSPDPVKLRERVTYTIGVRNNGPDAASSVNVTDSLPASATFVSVTTTVGSCTGTTTVTCSLGTLASGATATITIVVKAMEVGELWNTASAATTTADPSSSNNSATATTSVVKRLSR